MTIGLATNLFKAQRILELLTIYLRIQVKISYLESCDFLGSKE
jgi:hypothetical protein